MERPPCCWGRLRGVARPALLSNPSGGHPLPWPHAGAADHGSRAPQPIHPGGRAAHWRALWCYSHPRSMPGRARLLRWPLLVAASQPGALRPPGPQDLLSWVPAQQCGAWLLFPLAPRRRKPVGPVSESEMKRAGLHTGWLRGQMHSAEEIGAGRQQ
ncbi:unnamed protein product [Amoebophrya sp. A120]|nr:unnamed protein product [Amoebophrya sp. A120]|eukprot:GSA120T00025918001.1